MGDLEFGDSDRRLRKERLENDIKQIDLFFSEGVRFI